MVLIVMGMIVYFKKKTLVLKVRINKVLNLKKTLTAIELGITI
jgi:hypothetical protein